MVKFVIEVIHFDNWMLEEYKQCSRYVGKENLIFTNVKKEWKKKLENYGKVFEKSIYEVIEDSDKVVILDPSSKIKATPEILQNAKYIVIGGILGNVKAKRRTKKLISSNFKKAVKVNIGKRQFSVDGACYVALQIFKGKKLKEIKFVNFVKVKWKEGIVENEVVIPFAYPVENGKIMISKGILKLIREGYNWNKQINF